MASLQAMQNMHCKSFRGEEIDVHVKDGQVADLHFSAFGLTLADYSIQYDASAVDGEDNLYITYDVHAKSAHVYSALLAGGGNQLCRGDKTGTELDSSVQSAAQHLNNEHKLAKIREQLKQYNQEHVVYDFDFSNPKESDFESIFKQYEFLNLDLVDKLYRELYKNEKGSLVRPAVSNPVALPTSVKRVVVNYDALSEQTQKQFDRVQKLEQAVENEHKDFLSKNPLQQNQGIENFILHLRERKVLTELIFEGLNAQSTNDQERYFFKGLKQIAKGQSALVILAGGAATRLGSDVPKGFYDPGLPSKKCLFQIFAERILALQRLASPYALNHTGIKTPNACRIHVYIMTSVENDAITQKNFKEKNFFGLEPEQVHFFAQSLLPALSNDGKLLLQDKFKLLLSPDGNGGIYEAIEKYKLLEEWERNGIEYIHFMGVDNLLSKPCDPLQQGMLEDDLDMVVKYINSYPEESTGRLVFNNNALSIIEYSEINAQQRVAFKEAFIANFSFRASQLRTFLNKKNEWLTYHLAKKKVESYIPPQKAGEQGKFIKKEEIKDNNALKFEKFIFDPFPLLDAKRLGLIEVKREDEFAPIKNANSKDPNNPAVDSPQTAIEALANLHFNWLRKAQYQFRDKPHRDKLIEIDPLVSLQGEGIETLTGENRAQERNLPFRLESKNDKTAVFGRIYDLLRKV